MQKYKIMLNRISLRTRHKKDTKRLALYVLAGLKLDLYYVYKDFFDTFKPFKTKRQVARDLLLQPFKGFLDLLIGIGLALVFGISLVPGLLVATGAGLVSLMLNKKNESAKKSKNFALLSLMFLGITFVASFLHVLRGASSMLTWPLTLILRVPLRSILTAIQGVPTIEESKGLREMVLSYENTNTEASSKKIIAHFLIKKFKKAAFEKNQRTNINCLEARVAIMLKDKPGIITIFKKAIDEHDQALAANPKGLVR